MVRARAYDVVLNGVEPAAAVFVYDPQVQIDVQAPGLTEEQAESPSASS